MLAYTLHGNEGPLLVLLHGFCENSQCFSPIVPALEKRLRILMFDLPGFGQSAPVQNISIDEMAHKVKIGLDALGVKKCVLMGHSMGGYVTLSFARQFPEMLSGFGLLHSTAMADNDERKEKRKQVINFIKEHGKEPYLKNFVPGLFANPETHKDDILFLIEEGMKGPSQGIIDACCAMMKREKHTGLLEETGLPVFFAIGKNDSIISETDMLSQASWCRESELCYLENSAHCSMFEQPEKLTAAIIAFTLRVA